MTALYVIPGIILLFVLAYYVVLARYLHGNIDTATDIFLGKLSILTPREQENLAHSMKKGAKLILRNQSILMLISAGIFAILPIYFSMMFSAICAGMAVIDFCNYKSINV